LPPRRRGRESSAVRSSRWTMRKKHGRTFQFSHFPGWTAPGALFILTAVLGRGMNMTLRWSFLLVCVFASTTFAQELPRTASGKPDLQGIWQAQGAAAYDLEDHLARHDMPAGMGVVDGFIP